jgi:hypothetical protein
MAYLGVGQIALLVDDFEAAVEDFHAVFGIDFVLIEHPQLRQKIAVSDGGIVLTSKIDPTDTSPIESNWTGRLTAIELKVTDIEETRKAMEARGAKTMYYLDTPGSLKEYYMYSEGFHGIPLTIFQNDCDSWLESMGRADQESSSDEAPGGIQWINQP